MDEKFLRRALALAAQGRGAVEPNPMVGAVLVRDESVLAEGYHRSFGGPHAEIEALRAATKKGVNVAGSTMYVTLEPCCHHGKTPPCTDAILAANIARVVVALTDPDDNVAGRGVEILRRAGVEITLGVCQTEARELLAPYMKLRTQRRPWCIAKWAQTTDGYLALPPGAGRWISGEDSRRRVHELRSRSDGILVGLGTVQTDDPRLTNRTGQGKQPVRVVLDSHLHIALDCQLVQTAREFPLLVATTHTGENENPDVARALKERGADVLALPSVDGHVRLPALLDELGLRSWTHLIIEGGRAVLRAFLDENLLDELQVYVGPHTVGKTTPPVLPRLALDEILKTSAFIELHRETIGDDTFVQCRRTP